MVYLPKEKLLIEADEYTPAPPNTPPPAQPNPNNVNLIEEHRATEAIDRSNPAAARTRVCRWRSYTPRSEQRCRSSSAADRSTSRRRVTWLHCQRPSLLSVFALAFAFGAIIQRTNFCTMGSVADIVTFGDWTRMRQWLLAIAVAILGTEHSGGDRSYRYRRQLLHLATFHAARVCVGGLLFGFGMVLTGGCGSKSLVRAGGGSLKSLVVLLVLGHRGLHHRCAGLLAVFRVGVIEPVGRDGSDSAGLAVAAARHWTVEVRTASWDSRAAVGVLFVVVFRDRSFRTFDNLLAGLGIGAIIVAAWAVSGTIGHVEEHPNTLQEAFLRTNSGRMEALSFVAPVAYTIDYLMFFSDTSKVVTIGIAAVAGMISGSAAYAVAAGSFAGKDFAIPKTPPIIWSARR